MNDPVNAADLAVAQAFFPPVREVCTTCNGEGHVTLATDNEPDLIPTTCHTCDGLGFYIREMDKREEHFYIMHLLLTRYQIR